MSDWVRLAQVYKKEGVQNAVDTVAAMHELGYDPTGDPLALLNKLELEMLDSSIAALDDEKDSKREASWFADCPRDKKGRCKAGSGGGADETPADPGAGDILAAMGGKPNPPRARQGSKTVDDAIVARRPAEKFTGKYRMGKTPVKTGRVSAATAAVQIKTAYPGATVKDVYKAMRGDRAAEGKLKDVVVAERERIKKLPPKKRRRSALYHATKKVVTDSLLAGAIGATAIMGMHAVAAGAGPVYRAATTLAGPAFRKFAGTKVGMALQKKTFGGLHGSYVKAARANVRRSTARAQRKAGFTRYRGPKYGNTGAGGGVKQLTFR